MTKYVVNYRVRSSLSLAPLSHLSLTRFWRSRMGHAAWMRGRAGRGATRTPIGRVPRSPRGSHVQPAQSAHVACPLQRCRCLHVLSFVLAVSDGQVDRVILSHYRLYSSLHSLERTTTYPGVPDRHRSLFKVRVHSLFPATSSARRHRPARVRRLRTARRPPRTSHPAD